MLQQLVVFGFIDEVAGRLGGGAMWGKLSRREDRRTFHLVIFCRNSRHQTSAQIGPSTRELLSCGLPVSCSNSSLPYFTIPRSLARQTIGA